MNTPIYIEIFSYLRVFHVDIIEYINASDLTVNVCTNSKTNRNGDDNTVNIKYVHIREALTKTGRLKLIVWHLVENFRYGAGFATVPDLRMLNLRWQPFQSPTQ